MDNDTSLILDIMLYVVFFVGMFLGICIGLVACATLAGMSLATRRVDRIYLRLESKLSGTHRIKYTSQWRFGRFWKIFPWEAYGLLRVQDEQILFSGESISGDDVTLVFDKELCTVKFIGRNFWHGGSASWVRISEDEGSHYFTPETGMFIHGSKRKCIALYEHIVGQIAAQDKTEAQYGKQHV